MVIRMKGLVFLILLLFTTGVVAYGPGRGFNGGYWINGQYSDGTKAFGYGYYDRIEPFRRFGGKTYQYRQYDSAVLPNYYDQFAPRLGMVRTGTRGQAYVRYGYNVFSPRERYGVIGAFNQPY